MATTLIEFTLTAVDDNTAELTEHFLVKIINVQSMDGLTGSTITSGASVDPTKSNTSISIYESDYPYGLMQFAFKSQDHSQLPLIPLTSRPKILIQEEISVVTLMIVRAQGDVGDVAVEWRTVDGTAKSIGKTQPDYVAAVGHLSYSPSERHQEINITILDNEEPESEKYFEVELLNPSGGASVEGLGSRIMVKIEHSDYAHGVFQFAEESLHVLGTESFHDNVILKVVREGGTIGNVNVSWALNSTDTGNDFVVSSGTVEFTEGQRDADIYVVLRDDTLPELDERFVVVITNITQGSLGEEKTACEFIIEANDDPYGVFVVSMADRKQSVQEAFTGIEITIIRKATSGHYGRVLVNYTTMYPDSMLTFLPGGTARADLQDFNMTEGSVIMESGETAAAFNVSILDDSEPEVDESIFVLLTSVILMEGEQMTSVPNSPRLGDNREIYSQLLILQNDDPGGVFSLSVAKVTVSEDFRGSLVTVVRTMGAFIAVSIGFEVIQRTATEGLDYSFTETTVYFSNGEREKSVPVTIIDDSLPEVEEVFMIRLLDNLSVEDARLGSKLTETLVTIKGSDDPHGAFGFETSTVSVREAGLGESVTVPVTVVRLGGTLGVVAIDWEATVESGDLAVDDVSPSFGSVFFVSNEARQDITITILHDEVPEGNEVITLTLVAANNGGRILEDRSMFNLVILPNDNPHGTVQFGLSEFIVLEPKQQSLQYVPVNRTGGTYGKLRVYYTIQELDLLYEATTKSETEVMEYYMRPLWGKPLIPGTNWNVKTQRDPLKACSTFCLLSEVCQAFDFHPDRMDCNWFSEGHFEALDNRTGYWLYMKNKDLAEMIYTQQARIDQDFTAVQQQTITIDNGQSFGLIPVQITPDTAPELPEKFKIRLLDVELIFGDDVPMLNNPDPANLPQIGGIRNGESLAEIYVVIASNDDANGVFHIFSNDPSALDNGQVVEVEERERLSVELVVERQGGSIGHVSVSWRVADSRTTAAKHTDYRADGATLTFEEGETQQTITVAIEDDSLPENDEIIVVELYKPTGGVLLANPKKYSQALVLIMANDNVAGVIGFTKTSYLAKEGDVVTLIISRSAPALGHLTVSWQINTHNSQPPSQRFAIYAGNIYFNEGETQKQIILSVLVDNEPKMNQEYHVTLTHVATRDIRQTGAASISATSGIAVITIEGGNEPHGVFGFALTAFEKKAQEGEGKVLVPIDRKFGAIGVVELTYDIKPGSLRPTGTMAEAASPDRDFIPMQSGHVIIYEGESSATIPVDILEDDLPEIDEVFLVVITSVLLISPENSSFLPRIDNTASVSEVVITANDGTQGQVIFPEQYANITVSEGRRDITLIIRRTQGTFGLVSVFCFAQNAKEGAVRGDDFNFDPRDISFGPGVTEQIITLEILEDTIPEPDEMFEIVLASPRHGLTVGYPGKAIITILASDEASGIINFDSAKDVTIVEPSENSASNSKASLTIVRAPGAFGVVKVPFVVMKTTNMGSVEAVADVTPVNGMVIFHDKQNTALLEIEAIDDGIPEEAEVFTVMLSTPEGGATLGAITQINIIIERNDAPYGLLQIYSHGSRLSSLDVEENVGTLYFDVVRQSGALGWVSVDLVTTPDTAMVTPGQDLHIAPLYKEAISVGSTKWFSFTAYDRTYALLLNPTSKTTQRTDVDGIGGDRITVSTPALSGSTVLYLWQGVLTPLQTLHTNGASDAVFFIINDQPYFLITNAGGPVNFNTMSRLYTVSRDGTISVVQDLLSKGSSSISYYTAVDDNIGETNHYLFITSYQNNLGDTGVMSSVYKWDTTSNSFSPSPVQYVRTNGAVESQIVDIRAEKYLVVANYYDAGRLAYEINSVIYKLDSHGIWNVHQFLPTKGVVDMTSFSSGPSVYLIVANSRDNIGRFNQKVVVYVWRSLSQIFDSVQRIDFDDVNAVDIFNIDHTVFLTISSPTSPSQIHQWDEDNGQFSLEHSFSGDIGATVLHPLVTAGDGGLESHSETYLLDIQQGIAGDNTQNLNVYQVDLLGDSDYVARHSRIEFQPGQTTLTVAMHIIDDTLPEETETFQLQLQNPRNGVELGADHIVTVNVLSNDNGHGIIEFSEDSLLKYDEELPSGDNSIQLNVVRKQGVNGHVVVRWKLTGEHNGINDITPVEGIVDFADGQSAVTIVLTVKDDGIAELDETSLVSLVEIIESGSVLSDRGAIIGPNAAAKLVIQANDSPHGVVMWEKQSYLTSEPDGSDSRLTLNIDRTQGSVGDIRVSYMTIVKSSALPSEQAVSGQDYVSVQGTVEMPSGVVKTSIDVVILADNVPEVSESFFVNITSVQLFGAVIGGSVMPSVSVPHRLCTVTIRENDNARGVVEFNIVRNAENRIDTYEGQGTIELKVSRTVGQFGDIEVTWQINPREADSEDYRPTSGRLVFSDGQVDAFIQVVVVDDTVPETLQTFDVELLRVTSGGATLGADNSVRVGILKNDSPNGVFSFVETGHGKREKTVKESSTLTDPDGLVSFDILRQGTDGEVNVQWRLGAAAVDDFVPPLAGMVHFNAGDSRKTISVRTKPDTILEGEEQFSLALISADNNADISPIARDATVIVLADSGASGQVYISPESNRVYIGEPYAGYDGTTEILAQRGPGMFGSIEVTWQILPQDSEAFVHTHGVITFDDGQQDATIIIQARDDSSAELRTSYVFELTSASGGATIDHSNSGSCDIVYGASDYPFGLFEFQQQPAQMVVAEDLRQVVITIVRNYGSTGEVRVMYTTDADVASDVDDGRQDFIPNSGVLTFGHTEIEKSVFIQIVNDDFAEGPEPFFINITGLELVSPGNQNFSVINGVQLDILPEIGPLFSKVIVIDKNDNAEGQVQFMEEALNFIATEDSGIAMIPIHRKPGTWGELEVHFTVENATAILGKDFVVYNYMTSIRDGESRSTINITIINDLEQEYDEVFVVKLISVTGGGTLGLQTTATITIAKSDFPNGKFGFLEPNHMVLSNPLTKQVVSVIIERSEGSLGRQLVKWRILGPNNRNRVLEETNDLSYYNVLSQEQTQGTLSWEHGELGTKSFSLNVQPHNGWEVAEEFVVMLYEIQGFPAISGSGERDPQADNYTLVIQKHGHPNGIVHFNTVAQLVRTVEEPDSGSVQLVFPLVRREGTLGDIQVHWKLEGRSIDPQFSDTDPISGIVTIQSGRQDGEIMLQVLSDDRPELDERFTVVLSRVEGGAEIDTVYNTSVFLIKYNDHPHGRFLLDPSLQTVVVSSDNLKRRMRLNVTRSGGVVGRVRVAFTMVYDQSEPGMSYLPSSGSVTFNSSQNYAIVHVNLETQIFLLKGSTFTVSLKDVNYIGVDATEPPSIVGDRSEVRVMVPQAAANSIVRFNSSIVAVNDKTNLAKLTIVREGSYGSIQVRWTSGFYSPLTTQPAMSGFKLGQLSPESDTITLPNGVDHKSFYIQVTSQNTRPELFSLYLSHPVVSSTEGGARLDPDYISCKIDPHGRLGFSSQSLEIIVNEPHDENMEVMLTIERQLGSEGNIQVWYSTYSHTALTGLDFVHIDSAAITFTDKQTQAQIYVQIKPDSVPETDEYFVVNITSVTLLPTSITKGVSPRINKMFSSAKVTVRSNSDPYGVLSVQPYSAALSKEPGKVQIVVKRKQGSFGQVDVRIRTVGGGEAWDVLMGGSSDAPFARQSPGTAALGADKRGQTIGQVLEDRDLSAQATAGQDYEILDKIVTLQDGETEKEISLYILDDASPENDEYVYVYIHAVTEGVRVAQPHTDNGNKGFTSIMIQRNDYWSGWVGFYAANSSTVTADEDSNSPVTLTVERRNATFGSVSIYWRAVLNKGSDDIASEALDLSRQLLYTSNKAECQAGVIFCTFKVPLIQDSIPENKTSFFIELIRVSSGSDIDPTRKYAEVQVIGSDYPNGMIRIVKDAQYIYINRLTTSVEVEVEHVGYQGKTVNLNYRTVQYSQKQVIAGVDVQNAIGDFDFVSKSGMLTFQPGHQKTSILVRLDLSTVSSQSYPKVFGVELSAPTSGSELGVAFAQIFIVERGEGTWKAWAQANTQLNDVTIDRLMNELENVMSNALEQEDVYIVQDILDQVIYVAETEVLLDGTRNSIMGVFCRLLDPVQSQPTQGHWHLSRLLERFAFSFLNTQTPCMTVDQFIKSPQCDNVIFHVAKWPAAVINGHTFTGLRSDNFQFPNKHFSVKEYTENNGLNVSSSANCYDVLFVDYLAQQWFVRDTQRDEFLNERIMVINVKGEQSGVIEEPVDFRVHGPRRGTPIRRAQCVYFDENLQQWTSGDDICRVTNNLALSIDDFVDCSCNHMSHYAVRSDVRDLDKIGYPVWFHVSCFICITGLCIVILTHHLCFVRNSMFAANLLMHLCFATVSTEICYVINAYLSPIHILDWGEFEDLEPTNSSDSNYRCIVMALVMHYFFVAQFTWMLIQAINFYKILVLNDEHTNRKYLLYFSLGWGLPAVIVSIFYLTTYCLYRFVLDSPANEIYYDVHMNKDICFVSNAYAGLAGVVLPAVLCVLVVGVVFVQVFQVSVQWQAYDDVYKDRRNIGELRTMLAFWMCIMVTWLWGGLHLAYGQIWMLVLFCLFNITTGLFGFVAYAVVRNPCIPTCCKRGSKQKNNGDGLSVDSVSSGGSLEIPYKLHHPTVSANAYGAPPSLIVDTKSSDLDGKTEESLKSTQLKVRRKPLNSSTVTNSTPALGLSNHGNMYVHPSTPLPFIDVSESQPSFTYTAQSSTTSQPTTDYTRVSTDFDDLIFALKTPKSTRNNHFGQASETSGKDTLVRGTYDFQAATRRKQKHNS